MSWPAHTKCYLKIDNRGVELKNTPFKLLFPEELAPNYTKNTIQGRVHKLSGKEVRSEYIRC